jgi:iron donor protein CyaY
MIDEHKFQTIANATLMHFFDQLEDAFERGDFEELDLNEGILKIETRSSHVFLLSKHSPSCQLWLASPISGGLHFDYHESEEQWLLRDGTTLKQRLSDELFQLVNLRIFF